jgi:hypothetical protein
MVQRVATTSASHHDDLPMTYAYTDGPHRCHDRSRCPTAFSLYE